MNTDKHIGGWPEGELHSLSLNRDLSRVQLLLCIIGKIKVFLQSLLSNIMWASWRTIIGFIVHNSTFDIYGKLMNKAWKSVIVVVVGQLGVFRRKAGACFYSNGMWAIIRKCSPPIFSRQFQNFFLLSLKKYFRPSFNWSHNNFQNNQIQSLISCMTRPLTFDNSLHNEIN